MPDEPELAVTHEIVAAPDPHAEETAVAAETAVVAAETAVALAHETAAVAELQAAERVADVAEETKEWQESLGTSVAKLSENVSLVSLLVEEQRQTQTTLHDRLEKVEADNRTLLELLSTQTPSPETVEVETGPTAEPTAELVTAGATGELGSGSTSLAVPLAEPERSQPAESEAPRRKRRWI